MEEKCAVCEQEIEPGSFPQLQFDGTWVCQDCIGVVATWIERRPKVDPHT